MTVAQLVLNSNNGKYQLIFNDEVVKESTAKYYITQQVKTGALKDLGIHSFIDRSKEKFKAKGTANLIADAVGNDEFSEVVSKFSVDERFDMIRDVTAAVARKQMKSAILSGEGGLGKSHTMLEGMALAGLVDYNDLEEKARAEWEAGQQANAEALEAEDNSVDEEAVDDFHLEPPENCFVQIKGYTTARGLYETLYEFNGRTIVFDDCDKVLTDSTAEMIFKGALDSNDKRFISWKTGRLKKGVPKSFMFTGTVVFVTNMESENLDDPLKSRSTVIDITMTRPEKIQRMKTIALSPSFMPGVSKQRVAECMDFVEELQDSVTELNMRTLIKAVEQRNSVPNWKRVFEYSACR